MMSMFERIEDAITRWCRVRGHEWNFCHVEAWCDPGAKLRAFVTVREVLQDRQPCWAVRVDAHGIFAPELERRVVLHIPDHAPDSYARAWALGADLARALERRDAAGGRA